MFGEPMRPRKNVLDGASGCESCIGEGDVNDIGKRFNVSTCYLYILRLHYY
jgi:hypothetical protein